MADSHQPVRWWVPKWVSGPIPQSMNTSPCSKGGGIHLKRSTLTAMLFSVIILRRKQWQRYQGKAYAPAGLYCIDKKRENVYVPVNSGNRAKEGLDPQYR